ncbi:ATP-binding protein [Longispora urticae]
MTAGRGGAWRVVNTVADSVVIGTVIQGGTVHVTLPARITPATGGLPRAAGVFTGRDAHLDALLAGLDPQGAGGTVPVSAVAGMAGVGKTELVLQVARRACAAGWFPAGVLFIDLFGYDPKRRLTATDALGSWLEALGVPGEHIPGAEQDRARLWRTAIDAYTSAGRRLLLIIDNAADTTQVAPLLPADPAVPVLVTSRNTLDLDARLHQLPVLAPAPAAALIADVIRLRRGPDDPRVRDPAHRSGLAELARLCEWLPLALRITAALLADRPHRTPAALAASLRDEHHRLDRMRRVETTGEVAVRAAFDLSYQHLTPAQARLFRLLPVNPGPTIATSAAARLADLTDDDTETVLQDLHRAHLIEEPAPDRWRQHDLLRLHATTQTSATPDEAETAWRRLLSHYLTTTRDAAAHLQVPPQPTPDTFADRLQALDWLDAERLNLVATTTRTAATGDHDSTARIAATLAGYLAWRRHLTDWVTLAHLALTATRALGDRHREGRALNTLGLALREVRRFAEAVTAHERAAGILREVGDRHGEGMALNNRGSALQLLRRFPEAISAHERAADIYREVGDRHGEGNALNDVGLALRETRRFAEATSAHERAADIYREVGDRHGEGAALVNLGLVLRETRRFADAVSAQEQAAGILREVGDRHAEGTALNNLGIALRYTRRFAEAFSAHERAADIFRELADRHGEGTALNNLGLALRETGRFEEAVSVHEQAAGILREVGDRHGEGGALNNLGLALRRMRRFEESIAAHRGDLAICREDGDRHGEGGALTNLGLALGEAGRPEEAVSAHERAAGIYREVGDRHGEGAALDNLGIALREVRRFDDARRCWAEAVRAFEETGDDESATDIEVLLSEMGSGEG